MSERYRPSNGTEGEGFMLAFCYRCERDRSLREETGPGCIIAARTMLFDIDEPDYPDEWTYDADGDPTCTAFAPEGTPLPLDTEKEAAGQLVIEGTV